MENNANPPNLTDRFMMFWFIKFGLARYTGDGQELHIDLSYKGVPADLSFRQTATMINYMVESVEFTTNVRLTGVVIEGLHIVSVFLDFRNAMVTVACPGPMLLEVVNRIENGLIMPGLDYDVEVEVVDVPF